MSLGYGFSENPNCHYGDHDIEDGRCVHCQYEQVPYYEEIPEPFDTSGLFEELDAAREKHGTGMLYWNTTRKEWMPYEDS